MSADAIRYVQHLADARVLDPTQAPYAVALALAELLPERAHTMQVPRRTLVAMTGLALRTVRTALRRLETWRVLRTTEQRMDRVSVPSLYTFIELEPAGQEDVPPPWPVPGEVLNLQARRVLLEHAERLRTQYAAASAPRPPRAADPGPPRTEGETA